MTKAQDKARERRRYEKQQNKLAERETQAHRNKQVVGVVAAVLVVVGGLVLVSRLGKDDTPAVAATPTSMSTGAPTGREQTPPAATSPAVSAQKVLDGCQAAPANQDKPKQFTQVPDKAGAEGKLFEAKIATNCGNITVELDGRKAPQTVASFLHLAKEGYWAPSPCHRLVTSGIYVLQCGDPTGTGRGNPGYGFGIENAPADGKFPTGTLAMARSQDPNSNGGQFFITWQDTSLPTQGGGYSIFGKVTDGMGIVNKLAAAGALPQQSDGNTPPAGQISILDVSVTEKKG